MRSLHVAATAHRRDMDTINSTPLPLFVTLAELAASPAPEQVRTTTFAGRCVVTVAALAGTTDASQIPASLRVDVPARTAAIPTTTGQLLWECSAEQLEVVRALAAEHNIQLSDAAAYIAQHVFPELAVLDSATSPVRTLAQLPQQPVP